MLIVPEKEASGKNEIVRGSIDFRSMCGTTVCQYLWSDRTENIDC